jgi:hypothetical protein
VGVEGECQCHAVDSESRGVLSGFFWFTAFYLLNFLCPSLSLYKLEYPRFTVYILDKLLHLSVPQSLIGKTEPSMGFCEGGMS